MKNLIIILTVLIAALAFNFNFAAADTLVFNSDLSWRADGAGDYNFKDNGIVKDAKINQAGEIESPASGEYEINSAIPTESNIATITANWQSAGQVILQVSADGGATYNKVANCVPLTSGFNSGKNLKWKALLGKESKLTSVRISYTCQSAKVYSFGPALLSGFKNRKAIFIENKSMADLFNYQIKIRVGHGKLNPKSNADIFCDGKVSEDFKDIRFSAADGATVLDYYLEQKINQDDSLAADFWVNVPQIPASGVTLYLYYNNGEAGDISNPKKVFDFFDGFDGLEIDKSQWSITKEGSNGAYTVAEGLLNITDARLLNKTHKVQGNILEYGTKDNNGNVNVYSVKESLEDDFIGISSKSTTLNCDWIRLRKLALIEPAVDSKTSKSKEENVIIAKFDNTVINETGKLALKEGASSGEYISKEYALSLNARIMKVDIVPESAAGRDFNLDLSFDGGKSFCKNVESGKFYYAPKNDFVCGNKFVLRALFSGGGINAPLKKVALDYRLGKFTLVFPNGSEVFLTGKEEEITWIADEYEKDYPVKIEYSKDGGKHYEIIAEDAENAGSYIWKVPEIKSDRMLIRVSDKNDPAVFDVSDKFFKTEESHENDEYASIGKGSWSNRANWKANALPTTETNVTIASNATIYADQDISFKSLTIGDGEGKSNSVLVLRKKITSQSRDITVRKGGKIILETKEPVTIAGNLVVKAGGIITHAEGDSVLDLNANNILVEVKAVVEANAKKNYSGGEIKLTAADNFSVFGQITADGLDGKAGKGGNICLEAKTFGGENAVIHARGGSGKTKGGDGGSILVQGQGGGIKGTVNVNGGDGQVKGHSGSIIFK